MLEVTDWSVVGAAPNADSALDIPITKCTSLLSDCTTQRSVPGRFTPLKEWITPGLVRSIRKRDKLHRNRRMQTPAARILYQSYNTMLRRLTNRAKARHSDKKFSDVKDDTASMWKMVNRTMRGVSRGDSISPSLVGLSLDQINSHFATVGARTMTEAVGEVDPFDDLPQQNQLCGIPNSEYRCHLQDHEVAQV